MKSKGVSVKELAPGLAKVVLQPSRKYRMGNHMLHHPYQIFFQKPGPRNFINT